MVSKKLLIELQQIIKEEYGVLLSFQEVSDIGNSIVGFFDLLININNQKL